MNISKKSLIAAMAASGMAAAGLTFLLDPSTMLLRRHGIDVNEQFTDQGSTLMFRVKANNLWMSMDFDKSKTVPSSFDVMDMGETKVSAKDKDRNGRIDSLDLIVNHKGVQYAYSDAHLEGDYSRKAMAKDGKTVENLLKIDGKWFPVTYYSEGAKAGVVMDGKETIVDPTQSPVVILGTVKQTADATSGKP
ncbi:MAG: hypothetical protein JWO94_2242 [Verrucomicrobiaceae bacterium]|nr:hypothetical protein [Verrucomicrobiaceae bacterium]